jgi:Transglycosylase SLT domain
MRRPHWRSATLTAISGAVGLAILAGCTSGQLGLSASDQTARYLQNARGRYVIPGPPSDPWGPYIREASNHYDIPETWIRALMRQESGGNLYRNGRLITSSAGAMGLMQVMPGTYAELRARHNLGPDPFDPHDNIFAGVGYMREMYDIYGNPGFLAAYNAGPNRLDDYLANQRALPDETRHYVAVIGPSLRNAQPRVHSPAEQFAMNQLPIYIPPGPRYGYGSGVQVPSVQLASAAYTPPVFTRAAAQPAYTAPAQPRVLAWATPPAQPVTVAPPAQMAYAPPPAQVARPPALAWNEPPRPVYTQAPVQAYAPPPQRTVVAREEEEPVRRPHATTRVALEMPRSPPTMRSGGGLHLISSAMAAEVYPARRGHHPVLIPVSYTKPERTHSHSVTGWKLHATGPIQAPPGCHKSLHGKTVCGPERL